ncbi:MAG: hypothetical protein WCC17_23220 [Candidatus Nitrosopolaris sp.]
MTDTVGVDRLEGIESHRKKLTATSLSPVAYAAEQQALPWVIRISSCS